MPAHRTAALTSAAQFLFKHYLVFVSCLTCALLQPSLSSAQNDSIVVRPLRVTIDPFARWLTVDTLRETYAPGQTLKLKASRVAVQVKASPTLFTCKIVAEPVEPKELTDLNAFLKDVGPLLVEVLGSVRSGKKAVPFDSRTDSLAMAVKYMGTLVDGDSGLVAAYNQVLSIIYVKKDTSVSEDDVILSRTKQGQTTWPVAMMAGLDRLRLAAYRAGQLTERLDSTRATIVREVNSLNAQRDSLQKEVQAIANNKSVGPARVKQLNAQLSDVLQAHARKSEALLQVTDHISKLTDLLKDASEVLKNSETLIESADRVDRLARLALLSAPEMFCDVVDIRWDEGQKLTVKVEPRSEPELARVARSGPVDFDVTLHKAWRIRPAVGLALVHGIGAVYPKFATQPVGDSARVVENSDSDGRFAFAAVLGLTGWKLDRREASGNAFWLETSIKVDDRKAFGFGAAVSHGIAKVGAGVLFTKHDKLKGMRLGQMVDKDAEVQTRSVYEKPKIYVSLSFIGLQPFLK